MSELYRSRDLRLFYAAVILAAAPFGVAVLRFVQTGSDVRYFYVALLAFIGMAAVAVIGKVRTQRREIVMRLAAVAFLVSTLLAVLTARLLGARAMVGVILVAVVEALFFAASMVLYALSRSRSA